MIADPVDHADEFVADHHRHRDRLLRPRVPVIYVDVGAADRSLLDADEDVVGRDFRHRHFLQAKARLGPAFYHCLHHFLHAKKLGEAANEVECDECA